MKVLLARWGMENRESGESFKRDSDVIAFALGKDSLGC